MQEPTARTSRLAIASGTMAIAIVGGAGFLLGKRSATPPPIAAPVENPVPIPKPDPKPALPQVLGRKEIISFAAQASDALASGDVADASMADLVGRRFSVAIPFGCSGPSPSDSGAALRWRFDEKTETLRVHVELAQWTDIGPQSQSAASENPAMQNGFWVSRPWSYAETCPKVAAGAMNAEASGSSPVTLPGQTLSLASPLAEGDTPPKPFESVTRVSPDKADLPRGLVARVTGRITRGTNGSPAIRCVQPAGIEQRPICTVAVTFDELSIEDPGDNRTIATWSLGRAAPAAL